MQNTWKHLVAILCLALVSGLGWLWVKKAGTPPRPDIVLITVEGVRTDRLGAAAWSGADTPHIDALIKTGRWYRQAVTPMPRSTPAVGSVLTGLSPDEHGSREVDEAVRWGTTIPQVLAEQGWRTLAVSSSIQVGPRQDLDRGFERFASANRLRRIRKKWQRKEEQHLTTAVRQGLKLTEHSARIRPIFLWVHLQGPGFPIRLPLTEEAPAGDLSSECRRIGRTLPANVGERQRLSVDTDGAATALLESCSALYDAELSFVDQQVGLLLNKLKRKGRMDNTVVVLAGTHGTHFGEDGLYFLHGDTVHDASLRVPLIISGPGIEIGVDDTPAVLEDIAPTLYELLGLQDERRPATSGGSLLGAAPDRIVFSESGTPLTHLRPELVSTGTSDRRHCLHGARFSLCRRKGQSPALFDRQQDDSRLLRDVSAQHEDVVEDMLDAWRRLPTGRVRQRSARSSHYKLVRRPLYEGGWDTALYDLLNDPAEGHDLHTKLPDETKRLASAIYAWEDARDEQDDTEKADKPKPAPTSEKHP